MKTFKYYLAISCLFFTILSFSQTYENGNLITKNNESYSGKFFIDSENSVLRYKNNQESRFFNFDQIQSLTIDGKQTVLKEFNTERLLLKTLVVGKVSLYQESKTTFYFEGDFENLILLDTKNNRRTVPGTLNVAFADCGPIRNVINNTSDFNANTLSQITQTYNNCAYTEAFSPTEREITYAENFRSDAYLFYVGLGLSYNNLKFITSEENYLFPQASIGVLASPGIMGSLQEKLYIGSELSYGVSSDKNITGNLNVKVHSFKYALESQYNFNSPNRFQPFIGGGLQFHADRFKGSFFGEEFNSKDAEFTYTLKAGFHYKMGNNRIGFSLRYIPEYTSEAFFFDSNGDFVPLFLKNNYLISRVTFYF